MIQPLADDSPLSQEVLPSVWAGYKKPQCRPITEAVEQTAQALQMGYHLSKEEADKISHCFWTESLHDFCVQYSGEKLTDEDHAKILKTANEFIKNGTIIKIDEKETDLIKLLAAKIVLNSHQRANHAMSHACFLNNYDRLPQENTFMLKKGISPIFYEKDEFDRSETLKDQLNDVPEDRLLVAFTEWFHRAGMHYVSIFNQMGMLLKEMGKINALILRQSMEAYRKQKRKIEHHHRRQRPRHPGWRGYGE